MQTLCDINNTLNNPQLAQCCDDFKNDSFRLYPQMFLLNDSRILITGGGSMWYITEG